MDHKVSFRTSGKNGNTPEGWPLAKPLIWGGGLLMVSVLAAMVLGVWKTKDVAPVPPSKLFQTPEHYAEGKMPVTELEKRAYADYLKGLKAVGEKKVFGEELHRLENEVALAIARKYHMPPKSIAYLVLKLGYKEVPAGEYVLPSEPD